jgi:isopentenyl-diphosphate Delta-isomerase
VETTLTFENRKKEHIHRALQETHQAVGLSGFDQVRLIHSALPEINFDEVSLETKQLGQLVQTPFYIAAMTAGHGGSKKYNMRFAQAAHERGWSFCVGSQRREILSVQDLKEWEALRNQFPDLKIYGNLGLSQIVQLPVSMVEDLVGSLKANGMIIHTNPLQEALQPEGTPQFKGGLAAIKKLCQGLRVPIILKETGCGFSLESLKQVSSLGLRALDISGLGGTHWGRIEGSRQNYFYNQISEVFKNWGVPTVDCLKNAASLELPFEIWASGGIRSGLDAAKSIAMGAKSVGIAQPILKSMVVGSPNIQHLREGQKWLHQWT